MIRSILAIAVVAILTTTLPAQEAKKGDKPKESPEQKAVRAYLKENLPTGKWEEIKWWGVKTLIVNGGERGPNAVRLKFRAENQVGGMSVYDDVFVFRKDKVERYSDGSAYHFNRERIFGK